MAASDTCFKLLLLYLHLIAVFEKAGSPKYGPKFCVRSEACFYTLWSSTRMNGLDYEGFCWFYSQDRGGRRHVGFGAGRAFVLLPKGIRTHGCPSHFYSSGDICPNPGPRNILDPCGICKKPVKNNQRGICCDLCNGWFHVRRQCEGMQLESYRSYADDLDLQWLCIACSEIPTNENETTTFTDHSIPNWNRSVDEFTAINHNLYEHPGLKLGHINVNGLKGKLSEIRLLLVKTSLDILAITETKLTNDTTGEDIGIEGYFTIRNTRDRNGGGVLLYHKDTLAAYEELKMEVPGTIEGGWINVKCQSQTWLIACVYRPPTDLSFYGTFNGLLEKVWSTRKIL